MINGEKMKYKLSVIIPCYNAENTIKHSINSVINQSLEFGILSYYCMMMLQQMIHQRLSINSLMNNIKALLSKDNSGKSSKGRNVCIEKASSEFLMFMDNDICKKLYNEIINSDSNLVTCSLINKYEFKDIKEISDYVPDKAVINEDKPIFENPNLFYLDNSYVWNFIFKKEIII